MRMAGSRNVGKGGVKNGEYRSKRKAASNVTAYIIFSFNLMLLALFRCKETKKIGIMHYPSRPCNLFASVG